MTTPCDVVNSPLNPSPAELQLIAEGDQRYCSIFLKRWEPAILAIASGYAKRRSDRDDLMQAGRLAVYLAALNFNAALQKPFENYAKRAIRNAVLKETATLARQRRLENPSKANSTKYVPLEEVVAPSEVDPAVTEWIQKLPESHATTYRLLYAENLKQREAAEKLRVRQPRVAQLNRSFLQFARLVFLA